MLDPTQSAAFLADLADLRAATAQPAMAGILAQTALRLTVPGVPDTYQGTEFLDLSLVDPDNRRPVDYTARTDELAGERSLKLALIADLLTLRRDHPALFTHGDYTPVAATGTRAAHVLVFTRRAEGKRLFVAVGLHLAELAGDDWWGDTAVVMDGATMRMADLFSDRTAVARVSD